MGFEDAPSEVPKLYKLYIIIYYSFVLYLNSTVINDTTKILNDTVKVVLSPQTATPSSPDKDLCGAEENIIRCIEYVATLTESKVVEVIYFFLLSLTSLSGLFILYIV